MHLGKGQVGYGYRMELKLFENTGGSGGCAHTGFLSSKNEYIQQSFCFGPPEFFTLG